MKRRLAHAFGTANPALSPVLNLADFNQLGAVANASNYTQGGAIIEPLALPQAPLSRPIEVITVAFTAYLDLGVPGSLINPHGRLGKIICGLLTQTPPYQLLGAPGIHPMPPLPQDPTLFEILWDPTINELPPVHSSTAQVIQGLLPVKTAIIPPQPIEISAATDITQLYVGVWITPSLVGYDNSLPVKTVQLSVYQCVATVFYDDGEPTTQGLL